MQVKRDAAAPPAISATKTPVLPRPNQYNTVAEWSSCSLREGLMSRVDGVGLVLIAGVIAACGVAARAQEASYPKPSELPNPYRLMEGWPPLPSSMNGGRWGGV